MTYLHEQAREELGAEYTELEQNMVQQKYGIIQPNFTASEKNLILREDRNRGK